MKKIRNYFLTVIVLIMMFSLTGCSLLEETMREDSENNAKVTILNNETLKIESPAEGKVKIKAIMMDDGVESDVTKEMPVWQNEEIELKASDFETAKYKPTNNSQFIKIVEVKTVTEVTGVERVVTIIFAVIVGIILLGYAVGGFIGGYLNFFK